MTGAGGGSWFVDLAGWILLAVSLTLPFVVPALARHRRIGVVFIVAMLVRQIVTVHRAYLTLPYSDAGDMHRQAAGHGDALGALLGVGARTYANFLASAYDILGPSWFLGQQLSNLAFALACIALVKLMWQVGVRRDEHLLLALFALPLSVLRYTSDTVRESYQILFFVVAVLWAVRFKREGKPWHVVVFSVSALTMGLFHDGLMVYSVFLIAIVLLWPSPRSYGQPRWRVTPSRVRRLVLLLPILVLGLLLGGRAFSGGFGAGPALGALTSGRVLEYAAIYRHRGMLIEARTTYGVELDTSSPMAFAGSLVLAFTHYMAGPFPWAIRGPSDVYGAMEALLRILLIFFAVRTVWRWPPGERRLGFMLLACYVSLAGIWSVGTVNYGTAIRHHLTTNWIVLILGGPALFAWLRRILLTLGATPPRRVPATP